MNKKRLTGLFVSVCLGTSALISQPAQDNTNHAPDKYDLHHGFAIPVSAQDEKGNKCDATLMVLPSITDLSRLSQEDGPDNAQKLAERKQIIAAEAENFWKGSMLEISPDQDNKQAMKQLRDIFVKRVEKKTGITIVLIDIFAGHLSAEPATPQTPIAQKPNPI